MSLEDKHLYELEARRRLGEANSRSEALRQILDTYDDVYTEYEDLEQKYEHLHTRYKAHEDPVEQLEEQLPRRSQIEEKVEALPDKIHYRERFMDAHGLSEPAETACIGRLIDGRERCPHNVIAQDDDPNAPPHSAPGDDHSTLWLDEDDDPVLYGMGVYQGNIEMRASDDPPDSWFSIVGFAEHYGLDVSVLPYSWYNFGRTIHVTLYPPERYRRGGTGE